MSRGRLLTAVVVVAAVAAAVWFVFLRGPATADPAAPIGAPAMPGVALLIPGHGGNAASLSALGQALTMAGWTTQVVDIGDGSGDLAGYAASVTSQARLAAAAGGQVALIGYSEGGLIARKAIEVGAAPYVTRAVTIATPNAGTAIAGLGVFTKSAACDTACQQMAPGSDFLDALPVAGDPSRWLAIYSESDDVVRPADSGSLAGATTARIQDACPTSAADHGQVITDPFVLRAVPEFLSTGMVTATCPGQ